MGLLVARASPQQLGLKDTGEARPAPRPGRWREAAKAAADLARACGGCRWRSPRSSLGPHHVLVSLGVFFSKLAVVSFGGAYALMAYMAQEVVETQRWLTLPEMVDGLGLAETTPGPLILVTQFVGFLAAFRAPAPFDPLWAGMLGAAMTTWTIFAPSFLWIFAGAPFVEDVRHNRRLAGALAAITAAVIGVILNLAVWFTLHVLFRTISEVAIGPLRWFSVELASLDVAAAVLDRHCGGAHVRRPFRPDRDGRHHGGARDRAAADGGPLNGYASRAIALSCQRRSTRCVSERQAEEDHDAGERQQQQRREHARDVEPVAGLDDAIGEARAGAGGAGGDLGHHRADQRQPAGDAQAAQDVAAAPPAA